MAWFRRDSKAVAEQAQRLAQIEGRLDELRAQHKELRGAIARLEQLTKAVAGKSDLKDIAHAIEQSGKTTEGAIGGVRKDVKTQRRQLERLEAQLEAVLRHLALRGEELPYPWRLTARRFGVLSQNGEDGITSAILDVIGSGRRRFVEIGCADHGWNTGFLAEDAGWTGLMVDHNAESVAATAARFPRGTVTAVTNLVTPDTIDALFAAHGYGGDLDLLSIDVDGTDYWLWQALEAARPRLVIIEYNPVFGAERAVAVPYSAEPVWSGSPASDFRYFGASVRAIERLGARKGYRLVALEPDSANAYLLRNDVAPDIPATEIEMMFRPQRKYVQAELRSAADVYTVFEAQGLPLVDVYN